LDPIGAGCRFVLLKLGEPNTKIRIVDHTVQLIPNSILEPALRRWYGDSREDIFALYPVIVRFIELYLIPRRPVNGNSQKAPVFVAPISSPVVQKKIIIKSKPKKINNFDFGEDGDDDEPYGLSNGFGNNSQDDEYEEDDLDTPVKKTFELQDNVVQIQNTNVPVANVYDALITIAKYMIDGLKVLQRTYKSGNAVISLQLYINLLTAGINNTYTQDMLPEQLNDLTSNSTPNFLDNSKIKAFWQDADIIELGQLLNFCFTSDKKSFVYCRAAINSMLDDRDNYFKQMVSSTNNA
jgi:hypothetical protein